jgi:hypothetical protein
MRRIFGFFCRNQFGIGPLHSYSDFGFEFAEIFVIEKRLADSKSGSQFSNHRCFYGYILSKVLQVQPAYEMSDKYISKKCWQPWLFTTFYSKIGGASFHVMYVYSIYKPKMFEPSHDTASLNLVFNTLTKHISSSKVSAVRPFLY